MKIKIGKIWGHDIETIKYHSHDILEFKINAKGLFEKYLFEYGEKRDEITNREIIYIEKELKNRRLNPFESSEELLLRNLNHIFKADSYFTNGQKVMTLRKNEKRFEIRYPQSIQSFVNYFEPEPALSSFLFDRFLHQEYGQRQKAETEVVRLLMNIETIRIPVFNSSENDFVEVRWIYPNLYDIRFEEETIRKEKSKEISFHDLTEEMNKIIGSMTLKCCGNCAQFEFANKSFFFQGMSNGEAGFCKIMRGNDIKDPREFVTNIWSWCNKFVKTNN